MTKKMVFLTAPLTTNPDENFAQFCVVDVKLTNRGLHTMSTSYRHKILPHAELPDEMVYNGEFSGEYSQNLIERCDALYVIMFDGWQEDQNVISDIAFAKDCKMQVVYLSPEGATIRSE